MNQPTYQAEERPGGWKSASPLPTPAELQAFYAALYYQDPQSTSYQASYDDLELRYKRLKCAALLHALGGHPRSEAPTFLDIGAGEGFLMQAAADAGYGVTGVDFSSFAVEKFFPSLKDRLLQGDIFAIVGSLASTDRRFDVCSAINVLEHVIDPAALLASLRTILRPQGVLAVTVPNDFSRLQGLLRAEHRIGRDFWFAPPQHLNYFNAENLGPFCAAQGYDVVDAFSDFPIDLFLLHPGSNYVNDPKNGAAAHRARMVHDLLIAEKGIDRYLAFYRAMFDVGIGRDLTVILRPAGA